MKGCYEVDHPPWLPLLLLTWISNNLIITAAESTRHAEGSGIYCFLEEFHARCGEGKVIVIDEATYGRMRRSRCITTATSQIGCHNDVTQLLGQKCSGRRRCDIAVPDLDLERSKPCPGVLRNYLDVTYHCRAVYQPGVGSCSSCDAMKIVTPASGYIASLTTRETGCGSNDCPWLLEAPRGHRIRLSLDDYTLEGGSSSSGVCTVYATIKESLSLTSKTICGGQQEKPVVYESMENTFELHIPKHSDPNIYFVFHYEVVGCPNMESTSELSFTRSGSEAYWKCKATGVTSKLTCDGVRWQGDKPACLLAALPSTTPSSWGISELLSTPVVSFRWEMVLVLVGIVTVGMVLCVLIVGVVCLKKKPSARQATSGAYTYQSDFGAYEMCTRRRPSSKMVAKYPLEYATLPRDYKSRDSYRDSSYRESYTEPYHLYDEPMPSPPPPYTDPPADRQTTSQT